MKNIMQNYENAMEYNPESFGRVIMLYVPMQINGKDIQVFVDSGAQSTIMSESMSTFMLCHSKPGTHSPICVPFLFLLMPCFFIRMC